MKSTKPYGEPRYRLTLLDTNVVQNLYSFGEYIYDGYLSPYKLRQMETRGKRFSEDIDALAQWMQLARRNGWPIAVSPRAFHEFARIPSGSKRIRLLRWAAELEDYGSQLKAAYAPHSDNADPYQGFPVSAQTFSFLPDYGDSVLIAEAVRLGCEDFLTMDYRTIHEHRDRIRLAGIEVLRPVELMDALRPWTGLLS